MNKLTLFQTQKDRDRSDGYMTYFNNNMYRRQLNFSHGYIFWEVWTDTVKWQSVFVENTLKILNDAYGEFLLEGAINE